MIERTANEQMTRRFVRAAPQAKEGNPYQDVAESAAPALVGRIYEGSHAHMVPNHCIFLSPDPIYDFIYCKQIMFLLRNVKVILYPPRRPR